MINKIYVSSEDLVKGLRGVPIAIAQMMIEEAQKQGNENPLKAFQKRIDSGRTNGGFDWRDAKDGGIFWADVLKAGRHNLFFLKYPEKAYPRVMKVYSVSKYSEDFVEEEHCVEKIVYGEAHGCYYTIEERLDAPIPMKVHWDYAMETNSKKEVPPKKFTGKYMISEYGAIMPI